MAISLLLALACLPHPAAALAPQNDLPTVAWTATHATQGGVTDRGVATAAGGDVLVTVGELRDQPSTNSLQRRSFVRAIERTTGVERWRFVGGDTAIGVAVAVDSVGQRVFAVLRTPLAGGQPGVEHVVAFDALTGSVLHDTVVALPVGDAFSTSDVDALCVSPDGLLVHRLDFYGTFTSGQLRVRTYDAATGAVLWTHTSTALDPFEYRQSTDSASLVVSPGGDSLYVCFETIDLGGANLRDVHVRALAASDGSPRWVRDLGTAGVLDRISNAVVAVDSSAVFVGTQDFAFPLTTPRLHRLASVDGSDDWDVPLDFRPVTIEISPSGSQIVAAGSDGNTTAPDYTNVALESFATDTGVSLWSTTYAQNDTTEDVVDLCFSPNGARIHAYVVRGQVAPPFVSAAQVLSIDAATGLLPWFAAAGPNAEVFLDSHWIDAAQTSPTSSQVSVGQSDVDTVNHIAQAPGQRDAFDGDIGAPLWSATNADLLPFHSDTFARVWLEPSGLVAITWTPRVDATVLTLERRSVASGALLTSTTIPNLGATGFVDFHPAFTPDRTRVAVERSDAIGQRALSVFEVTSGALVYEKSFAANTTEIYCRWNSTGTKLHYATRGFVGKFGVVDIVAGTPVWEQTVTSPSPFGGLVVPQGLAIDPNNGAMYVSYDTVDLFSQVSMNHVSARAASTGASLWSFDTPNNSTLRFHREPTNFGTLAYSVTYGAELTALRMSADGTHLFACDTFLSGAATISRIGSFDVATGVLVWLSSSSAGPGVEGRTLDMAVSLDGRFVHVLAEGRGASALGPKQVLISTHDATTGVQIWQQFVPSADGHTRKIASLGLGWRVAVMGDFDTNAGLATGGYVAVLDAANGAELWRWTAPASERGDLLDFDVAEEGAIVIAGNAAVGHLDVDGLIVRLDPATLQQGPDVHSLMAGGHNEYHIDLPTALAGHVYIVVGSVSGISPGLPLPGGFVLPLNYDGYTFFTQQQVNSHNYVNSLGTLDARGDVRMRLFIPAGEDRVFAGLPFAYAAVTLDPLLGVVSAVTNAAQLTMQL